MKEPFALFIWVTSNSVSNNGATPDLDRLIGAVKYGAQRLALKIAWLNSLDLESLPMLTPPLSHISVNIARAGKTSCYSSSSLKFKASVQREGPFVRSAGA